MASTALHKRCSFGLRCPLNNCIYVIVEEAQGILAVLGLSVVPGDEVILQVHFYISMLGAALPQESVGKVVLFGVLAYD